jgi:hypothetical protein
MVHSLDDVVVVEVDNIDLLVDHLRIEERELAGAPADVIPRIIVEDADTGGGTEDLRDLVLGSFARVNFSDFVRRRKIATLLDGSSAARQRDSSRQSSESGE